MQGPPAPSPSESETGHRYLRPFMRSTRVTAMGCAMPVYSRTCCEGEAQLSAATQAGLTGCEARLVVHDSVYGHDAFLKEATLVNAFLEGRHD